MYASDNPKTKKALAADLAKHGASPCYQPGPFGPAVPNGWHTCEGPHYPAPHKWYARVRVSNGCIVEIQGDKKTNTAAADVRAAQVVLV